MGEGESPFPEVSLRESPHSQNEQEHGEPDATPNDPTVLEASVVAHLFIEHSAELHRFLSGVLRDSQLAADAMQMAYAKLIERGHEAEPSKRKSWLFQVAYREALAIRRRETTGNKIRQKIAQPNWLEESDSSIDALVKSETIELVKAALSELSDVQQQVVHKRIYENKKFAQIAEELNISINTALGRMRSALEHLRRKLRSEQE